MSFKTEGSHENFLANVCIAFKPAESVRMVEMKFRHFSLPLNVENFTDIRQSKFGSKYLEIMQNPVFDEICTFVEGIIGNYRCKV
jgi:hypothetical protein